jgi:hypothetical protein
MSICSAENIYGMATGSPGMRLIVALRETLLPDEFCDFKKIPAKTTSDQTP